MPATTTNMGIKTWNLGSDPYVRQDLIDNWNVIDAHDHTTTKGLQVPTAGIKDGAVTTAKVAANAIDGTKIAAASVADAALTSPNNSVYRQVGHANGQWDGTSGTYVLGTDLFYLTSTTNMPKLWVIPVVTADHLVNGLNTRYRMRVWWGTNSVAATAGGAVTFGLYPILGTTGNTGLFTVTIGTVVAGSTLTVSAPAANASANAATGDLVLADSMYAFGLTSAGLPPSGLQMNINYRLQVHNV